MARELMICMAMETGGTFDPAEGYNIDEDAAVGLVQFTPSAIDEINAEKWNGKYNYGLTITKKVLSKMTVEHQLDYVKSYFKINVDEYRKPISNALDVYMCIFCPRAVGKPNDYVLYSETETLKSYKANASIDGEAYDEKKHKLISYPNPEYKIRKNGKKRIIRGEKGYITKGDCIPRYKDKKWNGELLINSNIPKCENIPLQEIENKGESTDSILEEMKILVEKHIPYSQQGIRNELSEKGLAKLDCSELVAVYLAKLGAIPNMVSLTTWNMTTQKDFREAVNSNNIDFVERSNLKDFIPQRGDIFVWRRSDAGHCGIVYKYDSEKDLVTILEALDRIGSADEDTNRNNGGDFSKGCTRVAVYFRTGKALFCHVGWKGYFRPKNYTKKL